MTEAQESEHNDQETPEAEGAIGSGKAASLAVKMLREEDGGAVVGGYLLLWGGPDERPSGRLLHT